MPLVWYALALVAFVVALVAAIGRRANRPTCRRCGYDCSAARGGDLRCPECGHIAESVDELHRRRRAPRRAVAAGLVALVLLAVPHREGLRIWAGKTLLPRYTTVASAIVAGLPMRLEHDRWNDIDPSEYHGPDRLLVTRADGEEVVLVSEPIMEFGPGRLSARSAGQSPFPPAGSPGFGGDIDGDGEPDLVITSPSGGSGGAVETRIYRLDPHGPSAPLLLENMWFADEDGDGRHELLGFDAVFAYRWTSGAGSTRPTLRFMLDVATLSLDAARMRAAAPSDATLDGLRDAIRAAPIGENERREAWLAPLLRGTIELLYAGRAEAARQFLHDGWRGTPDELVDFEGEFREAFDESAYATWIRDLNEGAVRWP